MTFEVAIKVLRSTRRKWLAGMACLWLAGGLATGEDRGGAVSEYQLKAAFLYNFLQFTDWPTNAFASPKAPIVIGVVGEDPFGKTLDEIVKGEVVAGRPLVVQRFRADEDLGSCHILFISRSEKERLQALLIPLKAKPVLTMSDIKDFAQEGGIVNLVMANKAVKLEVNQGVAEESGMEIRGKLLKLARIVRTE